jgi:hypothetical protein
MQLLFYASKNDTNENRLEAAIRSATPGGTIEHFSRLTGLRDRLRSIVEPDSIMILAAVDKSELLEMQAFRAMLSEIFIILVLPDRQKGTIRLAHLLRPRYIGNLTDDFSDLNQIVSKMIRTPHGSPPTPDAPIKPAAQTVCDWKRRMGGLRHPSAKVPEKRKSTVK